MYGGYLDLQKKLLNGGCAFCVVRVGHTVYSNLVEATGQHSPYPALLDVQFFETIHLCEKHGVNPSVPPDCWCIRGVWVPQPAIGGPWHFRSVVRLVWLQPRLYLDHEIWKWWCPCCSGSNEHHPGCSNRWHHRLPAPIRHHKEVWCGCSVQWDPGGLGVHHRRLW